jgi:hypothetical protein
MMFGSLEDVRDLFECGAKRRALAGGVLQDDPRLAAAPCETTGWRSAALTFARNSRTSDAGTSRPRHWLAFLLKI